MTGNFDQEDMEPERVDHGEVVTLGFGKLLALLFILLVVCGFCFGLGYFVGHRAVKPATTAISTPAVSPTVAEQQPLQANGASPKPSTIVPDTSSMHPTAPDVSQPNSVPGAYNTAQAPSKVSGKVSGKTSAPKAQSQPVSVVPPRAVTKQPQQPADSSNSTPIPPGSYMVQIAAVAKPEDAEVLVNALHKLKYSVTAQHGASDNLIHVRMGPFSSRAEADEWRTLLSNDGYNAVLQQ